MRTALDAAEAGVTRVGIYGGHVAHSGCNWCLLDLSDGASLRLFATEQTVQPGFEVFSISVSLDQPPTEHLIWYEVEFVGPLTVRVLETEEWLDPQRSTVGAVGNSPTLQVRGAPGSAPQSAVAICSYPGGLELSDEAGRSLFVATSMFPYAIHVEGLADDDGVSRDDYENAA
ncbi:MAG: hypothetical protein AAF680_00030 [Pseudomonadota bacterium]